MNEDDRRLVHFLQHHRPVPPPAPPQAEAQLMQALTELPADPWLRQTVRMSGVSMGALLGVLVAALATGWWMGQRRALALAEAQRLETILLEEWNASLTLAEGVYVDWVRDDRP